MAGNIEQRFYARNLPLSIHGILAIRCSIARLPPLADATLSLQQRRDIRNTPVISVRSESTRGPRVRTHSLLRHSVRFRPVCADACSGVALFHRHTLAVALAGLGVITAYKLIFTGFKDGAGLAGLGLHLGHEFSLLSNLFLLLMGFALLSRHFEESAVPDEMPALLPDNWTGGVRCS